MNTFILFWNPKNSISNIEDSENKLRCNNPQQYQWAIRDWQKVNLNDRYLRIRCGMADPAGDGIIDAGFIVSKPVEMKKIGHHNYYHYVKLQPFTVIDYNHCPVLSSNLLDLRIPNFNWHFSWIEGVLLDPESADILETLWLRHVDALSNDPKTSTYVYHRR